jgi:hypothetical protein
MHAEKTIPAITIEAWSTMAMPGDELRNILLYLAYKTGKPITFRWYSKDEGYSQDSVSVRIYVSDESSEKQTDMTVVVLGTKVHDLAEQQVPWTADVEVDEKHTIYSDNQVILAYIDHNRIIIPIELTAVDNETARHLMAHIMEKAVELLDFKADGTLPSERDQMTQSFCKAFKKGVQDRVYDHKQELDLLRSEAEQAYHTIVSYHKRKPVIEKELQHLQKLDEAPDPLLFRKQAKLLIDLQKTGLYTSIAPQDDGFIKAFTGPVSIEYQGHEFPLGCYEIAISNACDVKIEALEEHPDASFPHPHVAEDGYPCLGNISATLPSLLASMRIAEALQLIYEFLSSYSPETGPYEKISHFDPTGSFVDEEDNPCEDCSESCSPFCIASCGTNDGCYATDDCCEYRTEYCYTECNHQEICQLSPCDNCDDEATEECYLSCRYNSDWELKDPCENSCEFKECSTECAYYKKHQTLKENTDAARK